MQDGKNYPPGLYRVPKIKEFRSGFQYYELIGDSWEKRIIPSTGVNSVTYTSPSGHILTLIMTPSEFDTFMSGLEKKLKKGHIITKL